MIRINDHKQLDMFDPWDFLSPKRRRMLEEDWPGLFKQHLLCELPVAQIRPFFTDGFGRPSKELYDTDEQRIDSVHIKSNMRRLGRISIFSQSINKFLVNLKRHYKELFATVSEQLRERYASKKALAAFSLVKPSESAKTLQQVSADLYDLIEQFKDQDAVCTMNTYKQLQRVLNEQCNVKSDDNAAKVTVKPPKEIPCNSLQNPSDPDATYSGHKGQGYQVQIMETFTRCEDEEEKEQTLNLSLPAKCHPRNFEKIGHV